MNELSADTGSENEDNGRLQADRRLTKLMDEFDGGDTAGLFQEPDGYFTPEKEPSTVQHRTLDGRDLSLRLVGSNPLWTGNEETANEGGILDLWEFLAQAGHLLWNAGRTVADHLEREQRTLVHGRRVLELGAGAGLPSLICALYGAEHVVVTDYPDAELIDNLTQNIRNCPSLPHPANIEACGYLWGGDTEILLSRLSAPEHDAGFDLLILADVLFNHSEHGKLLISVQKTLRQDPQALALVFFTPYRPWLLQKDLAFFDLATQGGFVVEKILEKTMDHVMFEDDPGDELLRRTVFGYSLKWARGHGQT